MAAVDTGDWWTNNQPQVTQDPSAVAPPQQNAGAAPQNFSAPTGGDVRSTIQQGIQQATPRCKPIRTTPTGKGSGTSSTRAGRKSVIRIMLGIDCSAKERLGAMRRFTGRMPAATAGAAARATGKAAKASRRPSCHLTACRARPMRRHRSEDRIKRRPFPIIWHRPTRPRSPRARSRLNIHSRHRPNLRQRLAMARGSPPASAPCNHRPPHVDRFSMAARRRRWIATVQDYASNEYSNLVGQTLSARAANQGEFQANVLQPSQFARQQNQGEYQANVVAPAQVAYQNQYRQYLDDQQRQLNDYLTNYNINRTGVQDFLGQQNKTADRGLQATYYGRPS